MIRVTFTCRQTDSVAAQAQIVPELMQHNRSAHNSKRTVKIRHLIRERGYDVAIVIARHVAIIADMSYRGRYVTVRLIIWIEMQAS